ncbi:hypothetical protein D3C86_1308610 [compost metagenome]
MTVNLRSFSWAAALVSVPIQVRLSMRCDRAVRRLATSCSIWALDSAGKYSAT